MPYIIKKTKEKGTTGYKVCKLDNPKRCFSKHPLSEEQAQKQRTAIILSEMGRSKKQGGVLTPTRTRSPTRSDGEQAPLAPAAPSRPVSRAVGRTPAARRTLMFDDVSSRSSSASDEAGPSQPVARSRAAPSVAITLEQCHQFFDNPKKNPKTGAAITKYGPKFSEIIRECYDLMDHDDYVERVGSMKFSQKEYKRLFDDLAGMGVMKKEPASEKNMDDKEMCKRFLENPQKDPKSILGKAILIDSPEFKRYYEKCEERLSPEEFKEYLDVYLKKKIPNGTKGVDACKDVMNGIKVSRGAIELEGYFKKNSSIPIDNPLVKKLIGRCSDSFMMRLILIKTRVDLIRVNNISEDDQIVRYAVSDVGTKKVIYITGLQDIIEDILNYIIYMGRHVEQSKALLKDLLSSVTELINISTHDADEAAFDRDSQPKKIYMGKRTRDDLVSMMYELQALVHGIEIRLSEESSSEGSSKRSRSVSPREGLAELPKRTRAQILEELGRACRDMRDNITFDDFEDMKKKKLQLVVAIGPKNAEGKQSCYYVKNIFKYAEKEIADGKVPTDPYTRDPIKKEDMRDIIMPKMRYIDIAVINPFEKKEAQKVPNIELVVRELPDTRGRTFYRVGFVRHIGSFTDRRYEQLGYIPTNIYVDENDRSGAPRHESDVYTGQTDVSSAVIMAKLGMLVEKGMLTNMYGIPRVPINKNVGYWYNDDKNDTIRKAKLMIDEFDRYLR